MRIPTSKSDSLHQTEDQTERSSNDMDFEEFGFLLTDAPSVGPLNINPEPNQLTLTQSGDDYDIPMSDQTNPNPPPLERVSSSSEYHFSSYTDPYPPTPKKESKNEDKKHQPVKIENKDDLAPIPMPSPIPTVKLEPLEKTVKNKRDFKKPAQYRSTEHPSKSSVSSSKGKKPPLHSLTNVFDPKIG